MPSDNVLSITYEKAGEDGSKCTYQQLISRTDLIEALAGRGKQLLVGHDPGPSQTSLAARERINAATAVASRG